MSIANRVVSLRRRNYTGSALSGLKASTMSKQSKAGRTRRMALSRQYRALRKQGHKKAYSPAADSARYNLMQKG